MLSRKQYIFGIDVGGTSIKIGLFDVHGSLLEKWEVSSDTTNNGINILPDISKALNKKIKVKNLTKEDFIGVGVGVPGPVNKDGQVQRCVNLGWGVLDVERELSTLINLPVKVANDANIAALGEMWKGSGQGYKNLVLITIGTGVGGGLIVDEKIVSGANGSAGELGHLLINRNETVPCNCGRKGCVEQYASATGIVNGARKLMESGKIRTVLVNDEWLTAKKIFEEAKNKDEVAMMSVDLMGQTLGLMLGQVSCVCDPQVILIGGGVSKAGQIIIDVIKKYYKEYSFYASVETPIILAQLGNDAGIYGAAKLVLQQECNFN